MTARLNPAFKNHLLMCGRNASYTSPEIQKQVTHAIAEAKREKKWDAIRKAKWWFLFIDESVDEGMLPQLFVGARYFDIDTMTVNEVFLTFLHLPGQNAEQIFLSVQQFLQIPEECPVGTAGLIGCVGDTCNTMFGLKAGFMTRMKAWLPNLFNLKCMLHKLNLTVVKVCAFKQEKDNPTAMPILRNVGNSTDTMVRWFNFSSKRLADLKNINIELNPAATFLNIKQMAPLRWVQRIQAIYAFNNQLATLSETLHAIAFELPNYKNDLDARGDAASFIKGLQSFETMYHLATLEVCLGLVESLTVSAQAAAIDFTEILAKIQEVNAIVQHYMENVDSFCDQILHPRVDELINLVLTRKQKQATYVGGLSAADVYVAPILPRQVVSTHASATFRDVQLLEQVDDESDNEFNKRRVLKQYQLDTIIPMFSTLHEMMKDCFLDAEQQDLMNAMIAFNPFMAVKKISKVNLIQGIKEHFVADEDEISGDEDDEDGILFTSTATAAGKKPASSETATVSPEAEKKASREERAEKKLANKKKQEEAEIAEFSTKLEQTGWPWSAENPLIKSWCTEVENGIKLLQHFSAQDDNAKTQLESQIKVESAVRIWVLRLAEKSPKEIFLLRNLTSIIRETLYQQEPLLNCTLRIAVTLQLQNSRSEKGFSSLNNCKTDRRSSISQRFMNDLQTIAMDRQIFVSFPEFIAKFQALFPKALCFQQKV